MAFSSTPPRSNAPAQLLPLATILGAAGGAASGGEAGAANLLLTSSPTGGTVGAALAVSGTVAPSGAAVEVGLTSTATTAPQTWVNATVAGSSWTAALTPDTAGTFYVWVREVDSPSVQAVSAGFAVVAQTAGSVSFSSPPTSGVVGMAMAVSGSVSPSGSAVQVGFSSSATIAPSSWAAASVSGAGWTASVTPSSAGTFFLWAQQTGATGVQAVSSAITITVDSSGTALTYDLISGSGNGSLAGVTLTTGTTYTVDWSSNIAAGATDVRPGVIPSSMGAIAACKFWFDSSATNTAVPASNYGNAGSLNNGEINFYAFNSGYGTPTAVPAAPATAGTYYGKFAMFDSANTLLGVFVTSPITIS